MKQLTPNWFAEGTIDLELKQYLLLAYLQEMQHQFTQTCLYPPLADLIAHYRNLTAYRDSKAQLAEQFPQELQGIDLEKLRLVYSPLLADDDTLSEIDRIVAYAIPRIKEHVEAGREIYDWVDRLTQMEAVGLLPLYRSEGYVLVRRGTNPDVRAYQYSIIPIEIDGEQGAERARAIRTHYVTTFTYGLACTYQHMKLELVRTQRELPNPATYAVESEVAVPLEETLLPIAKRRLLQMQ